MCGGVVKSFCCEEKKSLTNIIELSNDFFKTMVKWVILFLSLYFYAIFKFSTIRKYFCNQEKKVMSENSKGHLK